MYLAHFGLSEPPFRITPHTEFFFDGANRGATLEALIYAVMHDEGIVKVSGEVGSGKTMLCRVLLERLPAPVVTIYLANPSLGRDEILLTIAEELKVDPGGKRTTILLRALQDALIQLYGQGKRVIVLIDEAHAMPAETLEEIRLLSNLESNRHKLLQIILFGQPELDEHLNLPNMRQLRERITHSFRLEPLVRSDVDNYVDFRMRAAGYKGPNVFAKASLKLIAHASEGLTRRINILADKSLLAAFADNSHQITPKHVKAAIIDSGFRRMRPARPSWWVAAATLAVGVVLGLGVQHLWTSVFTDGGAAHAPAPPSGSGTSANDSPASSNGSAAPVNPASPPFAANQEGAKAPERSVASDPGSSAKGPGTISPGNAPSAAGPKPAGLDLTPNGAPAATPINGPPAASARVGSPSAAPPAGSPSRAGSSVAGTAIPWTPPPGPSAMPPTNAAASSTGAPASAEAPASAAAAQSGGHDGQGTGPAPIGGPFKTTFAQERYAAARSWMAAAPDGAFTIQLMTAREGDAEWVENFVGHAQQLANSDQIYVYSWPFDGGMGYRVAYGLFETVWACRDAIAQLPESLRRFQPYPERMAVVRKLAMVEPRGMAQR